MSNYKEGLDSILQAINNLITPQLVSLKYDKTFRGKITSIIDNGLYEVQVNGRSYTLPYAGTLQVGDIVKVKSPLNNFSDIYIEAIGGSGGGSTTTDYNDLTSKPILNTNYTSSLSPDSSEIIKGTIGLHKISKTGKYSDLIGTPDLDFIPNSEKGVAGGVATLDENSKLPTSQLPGGIVTDPNYVHTDNNFTNALLTKLNGIESGAQVNKIESISKNGEALTITNKNVNIEVPTKLSELENDNNTVTDKDYVHTDNNFTNALLTKLNGIESGAEVNAIAGIKTNGVLQPIVNKIVDISIPTKTSQLTNDSGYIDNTVNDLENYYKKNETYNQTQVNNLLNNKADKTEIPTKVSELENDKGYISEIPVASATQLGGIKVGDNLVITEDGVLSSIGGSTGTSDYNALSNKPALNTDNSVALEVNAQEEISGTVSLHKVSKTGNYNDLLNKPNIPSKTSDLTNDSGYITNTVDNLTNYYKKAETYNQTEVDNLLADKANKSDVPTKTSQLTNDGSDGTNPFISEIPIASSTQLGGIKVGNNLSIEADGTLNASEGEQKTHKYKISGSPMKEVLPGGKITLPCTYKVGAGVLDIYFNGELLILSADAAGSNGHYLEVGTTGSISNEIQLTNDWGTSSDYYLAIVVRGEYGNPNITFKVGTAQYQAEKGMTFNEYTSSSYNVDGFYVYGANHYVYTGDGKTFYPPSGTNLVVGSDTIISGGNYTLNEG